MSECCLGERQLMEQLRPLTGNSLEISCVYLFILILCLPVHENHKHFLVWERFVSAHGAATALNKESLVFLFLFVYIKNIVFLFIKSINIFLFGHMLCQLMDQLLP